MLDDQSAKDKELRKLEAEKDATETKVKELTAELNQVTYAFFRLHPLF